MDAVRGNIAIAGLPLTGTFLAGRFREGIDPSDLRLLEDAVETLEQRPDGSALVSAGKDTRTIMFLVEGFAFQTVHHAERRFIVGISVPGDFLNLPGLALGRTDHGVNAAGTVRVGLIKREKLQALIDERPGLARAFWLATLLDGSVHRKWIQNLERLDAPNRIAHHYAELQTRLELAGRHVSRVLRTPFTQVDLADMCGVSAIHANRAVGKLRELGIGEIRRGDLFTEDWSRLKEYAGFDPSYLFV